MRHDTGKSKPSVTTHRDYSEYSRDEPWYPHKTNNPTPRAATKIVTTESAEDNLTKPNLTYPT
jgi:hypothetical protein